MRLYDGSYVTTRPKARLQYAANLSAKIFLSYATYSLCDMYDNEQQLTEPVAIRGGHRCKWGTNRNRWVGPAGYRSGLSPSPDVLPNPQTMYHTSSQRLGIDDNSQKSALQRTLFGYGLMPRTIQSNGFGQIPK